VVLGTWAYPDGFAAIVLAELLGVPAVVKLHGSDMNVVARLPGPRQRLCWALPRAARVVAVSRPLARAAEELGVPEARIDVVPNGVDTTQFRPADRSSARRELGLDADRPLVLYVGRVEREKGVFDLARAFELLAARNPAPRLAIVGDGSALAECRRRLAPLADRVTFAGARDHAQIPTWLAACDLFVLPSWNEGMPNVVVEAVACGRKVVATNVGANPDILHSPLLGETVEPRAPEQLAHALERELACGYDPLELRAAAQVVDWNASARRLEWNLEAAVADYSRAA
jgi:glycosyltransferase involved in cell wall biosynthesis